MEIFIFMGDTWCIGEKKKKKEDDTLLEYYLLTSMMFFQSTTVLLKNHSLSISYRIPSMQVVILYKFKSLINFTLVCLLSINNFKNNLE